MAAIDPAFGVGGKKTTKFPKLTGGITASKESQSLYVDPTPAYQPVLDYLKKQTELANTRYGQNKTDITNLFGALTTVAAEDTARINEQFTQSIASQQSALAARTAEARQGAAAGVAQAEATGAERGAGPGMAVNPIQVATQEGIDRSNAYQTTWQALQEANKQQAVTDVGTRQAGYGQQQVGALKQLQQNLEDKLMQIGGNTAQVESDIAKAKIGATENVAQANYAEMAAQKAAQQRLAQAQAAAANKTSKGIQGWYERVAKTKADPAQLENSVSVAYDEVAKEITKNWDSDLSGKPPVPTKQQVISKWNQINGGGNPLVTEYINNYYFG